MKIIQPGHTQIPTLTEALLQEAALQYLQDNQDPYQPIAGDRLIQCLPEVQLKAVLVIPQGHLIPEDHLAADPNPEAAIHQALQVVVIQNQGPLHQVHPALHLAVHPVVHPADVAGR